MLTVLGLLVAAVILASRSSPSAQTPPAEPLNPQFEQLIDRYITDVRVGGRGVNDMSATSFERRLNTQHAFLKDLHAIDRKTLSFDQSIDYRFLESILKGEIIKAEGVKLWQMDPRQYLAARQPMAYKLSADPRSPAVRAPGIIQDLKLLQAQIANGRKNLTRSIPRWLELSISAIDSLLLLLENDVPAFANRVSGSDKSALLTEAKNGIASVRDFRNFVTTELKSRPMGDYKLGPEAFNALQEGSYLFPADDIHLRRVARGMPNFTRVPGYYDWGWRQFRIVEQELTALAKTIDPGKPWLQVLREVNQAHPSAERLIFAHLEAARRTRDWVLENNLVTIPWSDDDATAVAADPSRWDATGLGGAPGLPTGSVSRKSAWTINPINPAWDEETAAANLSDKTYSYLNVVAPHEVYPGHWLMGLYRNDNKRKLRQYVSSYSNQGWCYYIEWELTPTYGFYPSDKQQQYTLEMLRLKLWRMGRVINEAGLHTGRLTYDEAVKLESERIGYTLRRAQGYIDAITSSGSGDTAAPTVGYFEWMLLREDYFKRMRELDQKGTLKDFHDRVYRIGFLPVTLVREALFHQLEQEFRPRTAPSQ
jgi:hypothetical protein